MKVETDGILITGLEKFEKISKVKKMFENINESDIKAIFTAEFEKKFKVFGRVEEVFFRYSSVVFGLEAIEVYIYGRVVTVNALVNTMFKISTDDFFKNEIRVDMVREFK